MKILMVSIPSLHFFRWTEQLKDSDHEIYWFNVTDSGEFVRRMDWINQRYGWRLKRDFPGRTRLKVALPQLSKFIERLNTNSTKKAFESYLKSVKPDVVHSFVLHISCMPILSVMMNYKDIKWIYSAWGNDLYYHQYISKDKVRISKTLPYLNYMFADCQRDIDLAEQLGFKGKSLGVFPGGGGYSLTMINEDLKPPNQRSGIIIKGYQGKLHRGLNAIKALERLRKIPKVTIFSADQILTDYIQNSSKLDIENFEIYGKNTSISHKDLCRVMNRNLIYIGNNLSDGMPNTLLEAICFGAFPIQSNPGGASAEIITHGENGLLIEDCENISEIQACIEIALNNNDLVKNAFKVNQKLKYSIEHEYIKKKVLKKYDDVKKEL